MGSSPACAEIISINASRLPDSGFKYGTSEGAMGLSTIEAQHGLADTKNLQLHTQGWKAYEAL
jgi:hypothetical protein